MAATAAPLLLTASPAWANRPGMVIGAYADGGPGELTTIEAGLGIGKRFDVDHEYVTFGQAKLLMTTPFTADRGKRTPYVNMAWNCGCRNGRKGNPASKGYWARINKGDFDTWIQAQALAVKAWGGRFYITWQHEPEQTYGWEGTPADYQAAWKRIIYIFGVNGASNAVFVTSFLPTSFRGSSPKVNQFWPTVNGANIQGLIAGSTGYNWACSAHTGQTAGCGKGWKSFADIFGAVNTWANTHQVSWWVTETGTAEDPQQMPPKPDRKAQWISGLETTANSPGWSRLTGVIFFFGSRSHQLFLPNSSLPSLDAFRSLLNDWAG
jgi:hypothetical protein